MNDVCAAEHQFYSRYSWCLNSPLTVEDLLLRFQEELDRYEALDGWQREESRTNLYLFVCAVACTADDHLALSWFNFSPLIKCFPQLRRPIETVRTVTDVSRQMFKVADRSARRWRRQWDACVAQACALLMSNATSERDEFEKLRGLAFKLLGTKLPNVLLKRRMRLPEAFRNQDMAHHDVLSLIRRFSASYASLDRPLAIVGLRTAGAYFAPLMAEFLKCQKWPHVSWFSIRPKNGLALAEKRELHLCAKRNALLLLVDDYPATGHTLRLTLQILIGCGIRLEQMVVLAPTHTAQPDWARLAQIDPKIPVFTIQPSDLHKNAMLAPDRIEALCKMYYEPQQCEVRVQKDSNVDQINARLAEHSKDGHHVRDKRVFAFEFRTPDGKTQLKKLLFKSVGWGWLGYHAYIAGTRLQEFVPRVIGLRNGLLAMEWIDVASGAATCESTDDLVTRLASYTAARARRLALSGDCYFEKRTYRYTGTDEMLNIIRAMYGSYLNRLKTSALRKQLYKYVTAMPTMIDGKMQPDEWLHTPERVYKADFEHHNFGGAEQDIADPAYDLAAAIFEFGLDRNSERELLRIYREESSDTSIEARILLHKLLYGSLVMRSSLLHAATGKNAQKSNARHQAARDFLVYAMNDFCAKLMDAQKPRQWSDNLFFLDLDGVFDQDLLGFPHATQSGLLSLALLRSHGFSVVINTGRSIEHVRNYCAAYGLPGGVAEFGAVFVDAVAGHETALIDHVGTEQLARCRDAIQTMSGVFMDPAYKYSIRCYRYTTTGTTGLRDDELKKLIRKPEFTNLTYISRGADSYILQKRTGKGAALSFVRRAIGSEATPVTAIGESKYDIGMLKAAEFAYAPANCAPAVRELARRGHCRVVNKRFQKGLLAAVRHRLNQEGARDGLQTVDLSVGADQLNSLMQNVLKVADRHFAIQVLALLSWWSL
jgi:hydroxymethylpyrimidine pyrophosphatase-like HAD family hydrolase/adenine/guanine phosphoribosyltransferase-like PRPP-binding protein